MSINRIYILPVVILYFVIASLSCNENNNENNIADSIQDKDSTSLIKSDTTTGFVTDSTIKKVTLLDTIWNGRKMIFTHVINTGQDLIEIILSGYPPVQLPIRSEWIDPAERNRILVADKNWKPSPLVFLGDSICAFSLNNNGMGRAGVLLFVLNEKTHSFYQLKDDVNNNRAELNGQVYYVVAQSKKGEFYIHNSLGPDSAEIYGRDVFKFKATTLGFVQTGKSWRITLPQFDTLLYPYDGSVESYKKYFTKVLATHK